MADNLLTFVGILFGVGLLMMYSAKATFSDYWIQKGQIKPFRFWQLPEDYKIPGPLFEKAKFKMKFGSALVILAVLFFVMLIIGGDI